jgi:hypothetical protein
MKNRGDVARNPNREAAFALSAKQTIHRERTGVMARPLQRQIIERGRALIEDKEHWCRTYLALDENAVVVFPTNDRAVKRCALGALIAAAFELTRDYDKADRLAHQALSPDCSGAKLINTNDTEGHAAVLGLLDELIAHKRAQ